MVSSYKLLKRLEDEGTLKLLIKKGIMPTTTIFYLDVYDFYLKSFSVFKKKSDSVYFTAEKFNISDQSVYRIILKMT